VRQALKDLQALEVNKVLKETVVQLDQLVLQVVKVLLVKRGQQVQQVFKVLLDRLVQQAPADS
jgi:hypothetical protein